MITNRKMNDITHRKIHSAFSLVPVLPVLPLCTFACCHSPLTVCLFSLSYRNLPLFSGSVRRPSTGATGKSYIFLTSSLQKLEEKFVRRANPFTVSYLLLDLHSRRNSERTDNCSRRNLKNLLFLAQNAAS